MNAIDPKTQARHDQFIAVLEADRVGVLEDMTRDRLAKLGHRVEQLATLAGPADQQTLTDVADELAWLLDAFDVANHHHHHLDDDRCSLCAGKQAVEEEHAEFADVAERGLGL